MTMLVVYVLIVLLILVIPFLFLKQAEYCFCAFVRRQVPFVPSRKKSRVAVVKQINTYYKNAENIVEVGSGFGGLARYVAKNTNANVIALENMLFSATVSKFLDVVSFSRRNKTIWCDAFKYLKNTNKKFDVALAYLGPDYTYLLKKYADKIDVLISLDFEIPDMKPVRIHDLKSGYVLYNGKKYPHKLFVYELNNRK